MKKMTFSEKDYKTLQNLNAGEKTTKEISWVTQQKWGTAYMRLRKLIKQGYATQKTEDEQVYYSISEKGKTKLGEYIR